jgi:hypothetical protein
MPVDIKYTPIAIKRIALNLLAYTNHLPDLGRFTNMALEVPTRIKIRPIP